MSSRASLPLPPAARVPLLPLSPVAPSRFHPGASHSLPDSSPSSRAIHLAPVQNSGYPSRSVSRYPPYFSLPPQRLLRLYRLYTFPFLALKHYISVSLLSIASKHPYFSQPSLFLERALPLPATIFLPYPFLFFLHSRHHVIRLPPPLFTLSISQYRLASFLTFALPFFQHGFPPSTFLDSPLSCGVPLAVPPSSVTPTSYFSMPPYPPRFVARCFLPPQGYNRRYLRAQHVHRSILAHLRSCQAGYIPAAASMPYPARVRVRSHYTLPRR